MQKNKHVVIGAGATGTATAALLAQQGQPVSVVSRSGGGPSLEGVHLIAADASEASQLREICRGAQVIYNCANPPYHRWSTDWPPLADSILSAAEDNESVLVTLSNLYGYAMPTRPMVASDPLDAPSVKGAVRSKMWHAAKAAHDTGRVRATEARASDFIGPGLGKNGQMGDRVVPKVLTGKSVSLLGRTDMDHSWTAICDVAQTLVALGTNESAWGRAWHVPTAAPKTQRELVYLFCQVAGVPPVSVKTLPKVVLSLAGLFVKPLRELKEVSYQFEAPFVMDSTETSELLGLKHTPTEQVLEATIASYRN